MLIQVGGWTGKKNTMDQCINAMGRYHLKPGGKMVKGWGVGVE